MSDFSLTTFAEDGQLKQVNNALAAANNGETALAIKTKDGVILACEKYISSVLIDETSFTKIVPMSKNIGITYAGLGTDFNVLAKKSRKDYQQYMLEFIDEMMPVNSIARECANLMQEYTQMGGVRPFGICTFYAGVDRSGYHLYQVDPSGAYYELKAGAIGRGRQKATQSLERRYKDGMSLDDGIGIVIDTLREGYDGELNEKNIELAVINNDGFKKLSTDEVKIFLKS
jgi:20S proteasome subunit alpha 2